MIEREPSQTGSRFETWKLIRRIRREERKLGNAQQWTPEESKRLPAIRQMRSQLPSGYIVPARKHLGDFFKFPRRRA